MLLLYSLDKVFVSFPLVMLWYFYLSVFLRYTLFAVVNHSGTLEVGHYTCFIRQQQQVCSLIASRCFTIIFNRNLVIWDCIGLLLLRSVIGSENSTLNQSDGEMKPITTWSPAFPALWAVCLFLLWVLIGPKRIFLFSNWLLRLSWFWIYDRQSKIALNAFHECWVRKKHSPHRVFTTVNVWILSKSLSYFYM